MKMCFHVSYVVKVRPRFFAKQMQHPLQYGSETETQIIV